MLQKRAFLPLILGLAVITSCQKGQDRRVVVEEKYVHKYGMELGANEWETRGKSGLVIATLDNGVVVSKQYLAGTLDGETTYTYPHSSVIEHVDCYEKGELLKTVNNDETGNPCQETAYRGSDQRVVTEFYETLAPRCKETYRGDYLTHGEYFTHDSKIEAKIDQGSGTKILRNAEGELTGEALYEGGHLVKETHFYPNGNPREVIPFRNGQVEGTKRTFLINGEPSTIEEWSLGALHGKTTVYKNGDKYAEVPYVNGKKEGVELRFKDGAMIAEAITWERDKIHGPYHTYFGSSVKTEWYITGQRVTKANYEQQK